MGTWFWASFTIGAVAFIMAVQPFTQAIWGRPKIQLSYDEFEGRLFCLLQNVPIRERILKILCVTRMPIQDLSVEFSIYHKDTKLPVLLGVGERILQFGGSVSRHITLPASITCAWLDVAMMHNNKKIAICVDEGDIIKPKKKYLDVGRYEISIIISADGKQIFKDKDFIISDENPYAYWVKGKNEL
jgi:hypothetical protein